MVIPTLGRTKELEDCLTAIGKQDFVGLEIVVVTDNNQRLKFLEDKYNGLNITIIQQDKKGLASARNAGLAAARGKIVSFIDDDVEVSAGWAKEVVDTFKVSESIGGVSGPTEIPLDIASNRDLLAFHEKISKGIIWKIIGRIYTVFILERSADSVGRIFRSGAFSVGSNYDKSAKLPGNIEVDYLEACNMSFRREILLKTGGFSPEYKGIGDWSEPDLAFRVHQAGYRLVFNPKAAVIHRISCKGVFQQRGDDSFQRMVNFVHFYFKWMRPFNPDKLMRFSLNLMFTNCYWFYKFAQTGKLAWLSGVSGTFAGLRSELCRL